MHAHYRLRKLYDNPVKYPVPEERLKFYIAQRIKELNINIYSLEKSSGLGSRAIRNIIDGSSKNPGIKVICAIALALNCSIDDMVGLQKDIKQPEKINRKYKWHTTLFLKVIQNVIKYIEEKKYTISMEDVLYFIEKIYIFSIDTLELDQKFLQWLIDEKMSDTKL